MRWKEVINNFFERQERKKKSDEPDQEDLGLGAEMGSQSMLEGNHGKIFGLSRKAIKAISLAIFVIFSIALIMATSDEPEKEKKEQTTAVANNGLKDEQFPNDYEKLSEYNRRNQAPVPQQVPTGGKRETPTQEPANPVEPVRTQQTPVQRQPYPAIPTTPIYTPPAIETPQVKETVQAPAPAPAVNQNDAYHSAIAFIGGSEGIGSQTENSASADTDTSSRMVEPTEDMLIAGTVIPAMLMTGIDTSLEGQVKVQILSDVTNLSGNRILIPAGSFALGTYNASGTGSRVGLELTTLVLPNGATCEIGNTLVAVDGAGYNGLKGKAHHHTGEKIFNGLIASGLTALATSASNSRSYFDASAINGIIDGGKIKNTATVPPGYQFSLYVTKNITL